MTVRDYALRADIVCEGEAHVVEVPAVARRVDCKYGVLWEPSHLRALNHSADEQELWNTAFALAGGVSVEGALSLDCACAVLCALWEAYAEGPVTPERWGAANAVLAALFCDESALARFVVELEDEVNRRNALREIGVF